MTGQEICLFTSIPGLSPGFPGPLRSSRTYQFQLNYLRKLRLAFQTPKERIGERPGRMSLIPEEMLTRPSMPGFTK